MAHKTNLQKHGTHKIKLELGPIATSNPLVTHAGKFMCKKCNKLIKWASQEEVDFYQYKYQDGSQVEVTYQGFIDRYFNFTHTPETTTTKEEIVYLIATYQQRNEVKILGAKWDSFHGLWYVKTSNPHIQRLQKYIHPDDYNKCGIVIQSPPISITKQPSKLASLLASLK
jgi:hypothetical protein